MDKTLIAVPSELPGGLDARLGEHFGHCDLYTLIEAGSEGPLRVDTLPNVPHQQGGCMAPVNHLARNGVTVLIAGGMGLRPLMGFQQAGIRVFHGGGAPTVRAALEAYLQGSLPQFTPDRTCGGAGGK